ncbi:hypothetical protein EHI8A_004280 [Entamoeba histolytica HM-1:IMSS-B]|uniref:Uncharacterized protein n=6 Tax=Entamoeba histolytica TaxID=5759 RepID=C4LTN9_ENTH1|nr:hypothetical protein EHI_012520 [Entamoeba histolytica HM-1:IMSS]EMD44226.1 Hypothetical protein EHI5A_017590 [Entamoeba histolytica KU27]EMH72072.1 hypothetical protein EHI8A_004280 [Entamoeba histolytica HM-1:IMSS-B]EMS16017.1 hypothetical protein KM1_017930 [Entamoeba histolytica HM-3:IMSS]ENY65890.1 hypothetical protein EHI7A_006200 [Entamoeba histolytica HM-1:IMSS-A]GAT91939.1 hypothetical protein CL6EHI_012520 [Entamoeba histolytica]|eukprot:XP_655327.1 hypothetical protein EHI_012520 [Entamoeba histolytica HM-1:IMSS]
MNLKQLPLLCYYKIIQYAPDSIRFVSKRIFYCFIHQLPKCNLEILSYSQQQQLPLELRKLVIDGIFLSKIAKQLEKCQWLQCLKIIRCDASNEVIPSINIHQVTYLTVEGLNIKRIKCMIESLSKGILILDKLDNEIVINPNVKVYLSQRKTLGKRCSLTVDGIYHNEDLVLSSNNWNLKKANNIDQLIHNYLPFNMQLKYSEDCLKIKDYDLLFNLIIRDSWQFLFSHSPIDLKQLHIIQYKIINGSILKLNNTTHLTIDVLQENSERFLVKHPKLLIDDISLVHLSLIHPEIPSIQTFTNLISLDLEDCVGSLQCPKSIRSIKLSHSSFDCVELSIYLKYLEVNNVFASSMNFEQRLGNPQLESLLSIDTNCSSLFQFPKRLNYLTKMVMINSSFNSYLPPSLKYIETDNTIKFDLVKDLSQLTCILNNGNNVFIPHINSFIGNGEFTETLSISSEFIQLQGEFENIILEPSVQSIKIKKSIIGSIKFNTTLKTLSMNKVFDQEDNYFDLSSTNLYSLTQLCSLQLVKIKFDENKLPAINHL